VSSDLVKRLLELAAGKHDDKKFALDAAERIEALEGEAMLLRRSLGQRQEQLEAADARAERLRVALERIAEHEPDATSWSVGWERKALEDDKPIRAAAGEEGK